MTQYRPWICDDEDCNHHELCQLSLQSAPVIDCGCHNCAQRRKQGFQARVQANWLVSDNVKPRDLPHSRDAAASSDSCTTAPLLSSTSTESAR